MLENMYVTGTVLCSAPCSGGVALMRSPEINQTLFQRPEHPSVAAVVGLANAKIALVHPASKSSQNLATTELYRLNASCTSVSSDGVSTAIATSAQGQVVQLAMKEHLSSNVFEWNFDNWGPGTCSFARNDDVYAGFDRGKVIKLRAPCDIPIWQSKAKHQCENLLSLASDTLIAAGSRGVVAFDTRASESPVQILAADLDATALARGATSEVLLIGTFSGELLETDLRRPSNKIRSVWSCTNYIRRISAGPANDALLCATSVGLLNALQRDCEPLIKRSIRDVSRLDGAEFVCVDDAGTLRFGTVGQAPLQEPVQIGKSKRAKLALPEISSS